MMLSCKREVSSRVLNALLGWGQRATRGKQQQKHCDHHAPATAALRLALGARGGWPVVAYAHAISVSLGRRDRKPPERKTLNHGLSWKGVDPLYMLKCFPEPLVVSEPQQAFACLCWEGKPPHKS